MADSTTEITKKIEHYIRLVLRQRWLIIIPLLISLPVGLYLTLTLPRTYQARTLILVEPQRVPSKYVESIVNTDIEEQVSTLRQQILSRTNLEQVINQFNLFSDEEYKNVFLEDKLENLRRRINIDVTRARRGADAFSINFKGRDPTTVKDVTNALAASFIDINLRMREDRAMGTSAFLDSQLEDIRKKLIEVEESLKGYRKNHMGELPEQLDANLKMLDRLQTTMTERQEALREAKIQLSQYEREANERMLLLDSQLELARKQRQNNSEIVYSSSVSGKDPKPKTRLEELKEQYVLLKTKYTEKYPDVIRLKGLIDDIQQAKSAAMEADEREIVQDDLASAELKQDNGDPSSIAEGASQDTLSAAEGELLIAKRELQNEIDNNRIEIVTEIQKVEEDIKDLRFKTEEYQKRVDATPKREQELLSLRRDYRNIQDSYSSLLDRRLEAEIAVSMERRSKGEQFRILDPAATPQKPISPDVKKLLLFSIAAGLGIGGGLIFLLDFLNTSICYPEDVEKELGIPVLAAIPKNPKPREKIFRHVNLAFSALSLVMIIMLFSGFALLVVKGVDPTLAAVRKIDVVNRFINI